MTQKLVWQNDAAEDYLDERDAIYVVITSHNRNDEHVLVPGEEWSIAHSHKNRNVAIALAEAYTQDHPGYPVRVVRQSINEYEEE